MLTNPLRFGLIIAALVLAADIITKYYVFNHLHAVMPVTSFLNLVMVWNRGVSFGMFASLNEYMPYILSGLSVGIAAWLVRWLTRVYTPWMATALGLVIGGAIGNVIDRLRFGAVLDFIDFYYQSWHYPAFNVADAAICVGVFMLLLGGWRKSA